MTSRLKIAYDKEIILKVKNSLKRITKSKIIPISSHTKFGINELKKALHKIFK